MPKLKLVLKFPLIDKIREFFNIRPWMQIIPWIETNIVMTDDVSAESDKPDFSRYCYQIEPLKQWEDLNVRKHMTICMCEQMGKTSLFVYGILYRLIYKPGSILVCYPSDSKRNRDQYCEVHPSDEETAGPERRASSSKNSSFRQDKALKRSDVLAGLRL